MNRKTVLIAATLLVMLTSRAYAQTAPDRIIRAFTDYGAGPLGKIAAVAFFMVAGFILGAQHSWRAAGYAVAAVVVIFGAVYLGALGSGGG